MRRMPHEDAGAFRQPSASPRHRACPFHVEPKRARYKIARFTMSGETIDNRDEVSTASGSDRVDRVAVADSSRG